MRRLLGLASVLLLAACSDRPAALAGDIDGVQSDGGKVDVGPRPDTNVADTADDGDRPIVDGYPAGPYGFGVGQVFPDVALDGYPEGSTTWSKVRVRDFFDPDGSKEIRGVLLIIGAAWCAACIEEAKWLPGAYVGGYRARGARFLTALIHDADRKSATKLTADSWRDAWSIPFAIAIDPTLSLLPKEGGPLALPYNYVLDPRTMRVAKVLQSTQVPPSIPALDEVLAKNGG